MGYEQEIETDKDRFTDTVYRFSPIHATFFLKKSSTCEAKMHNTFFKIWTNFPGPPHLFTFPIYINNVLGQVYERRLIARQWDNFREISDNF